MQMEEKEVHTAIFGNTKNNDYDRQNRIEKDLGFVCR